MDKRNRLERGARLPFPGMECEIHSVVGSGANAIVYLGAYPDQMRPDLKHRVLVKELFPYHPQGLIYRAGDGTVQVSPVAEETFAWHRSSFMRGNEIHLKLLERFPNDFGTNLNTFSLNGTLYCVLGFAGGRTLKQEMAEKRPLSLATLAGRMLDVLDDLETMHTLGYLHLDVSPDNILIVGDGKRARAGLIDYNSACTLKELKEGAQFFFCVKEGYTAQEVRDGIRERMGPWTDFYSLAAVFYCGLAGQPLSVLETSQAGAPPIPETEELEGLSRSVRSMLRHILRRGLVLNTSRRYQTADEMRRDFTELLDRIEGRGITHWALWEAGRGAVRRVVGENPAFRYIQQEDELFPLSCVDSAGKAMPFEEAARRLWEKNGGSFLLLGGGGMGKTTALLSLAFRQEGYYSGQKPAICYLPLHSWNSGGDSYIKDRLLENMVFKPSTGSLEMARHELVQLLSVPIMAGERERPKLILLLDGWNEAKGERGPLLEEIRQLSALCGVRICMASRSHAELPDWPVFTLSALGTEEIMRHLSRRGLLLPEDEGMQHLLANPFLLSLFMNTAANEGAQLFIRTKEELLDRYFQAMIRKAGEGEERYIAEAAVRYVLPELTHVLKRKGSAPDEVLLPAAQRCYQRLMGRDMRTAFPEWIGHFSSIRGEAADAEAWYGLLVHGFLWRRLGFLVREPGGQLRLFHLLLEEYLLLQRKENLRKIRLSRMRRRTLTAGGTLVLAGCLYRAVYVPYLKPMAFFSALKEAGGLLARKVQAYDAGMAENVLDTMGNAYVLAARQYQSFCGLIGTLKKEGASEDAYQRVRRECQRAAETSGLLNTERAMRQAALLLETGEAFPWSKKPLDMEAYGRMVALPGEREEGYLNCLSVIDQMRERQELWQAYADGYLSDLSAALEADAMVAGKLYEKLLAPEYKAMVNSLEKKYREMYDIFMEDLAMLDRQTAVTDEVMGSAKSQVSIQTYERQQTRCWNRLAANAVYGWLA